MKLKVFLIIVILFLLYKKTEHLWFETRVNTTDYTQEVKRTEISNSAVLLPAGSECVSDANCTPGMKCAEMVKTWEAASPLQENAEVGPLAGPTTKGSMKVCRFVGEPESCSDFGRPSTNCF